jgi:hypothetical protein
VKKVEGVKLGRPSSVSKSIVNRIARERKKGASLRCEIAQGLNDARMPTGHGVEQWYVSNVSGNLTRARH